MSSDKSNQENLNLLISGYVNQYSDYNISYPLNQDMTNIICNMFDFKNSKCIYYQFITHGFKNGIGWQESSTIKFKIKKDGSWIFHERIIGDTAYSDDGYEKEIEYKGNISFSFKGLLKNYIRLNGVFKIATFDQDGTCIVAADHKQPRKGWHMDRYMPQ